MPNQLTPARIGELRRTWTETHESHDWTNLIDMLFDDLSELLAMADVGVRLRANRQFPATGWTAQNTADFVERCLDDAEKESP